MFNATFVNCSGLTGAIPSGLFGNLSGAPANSMYAGTFSGCSGLSGSIPTGLFGNLSGAPASYMFNSTFFGCSNLTGTIPSGLFGNISGTPAQRMFSHTFTGCSRLTGSIPSGLFGTPSGAPAEGIFASTFFGCSGLTGSIPSGLFGNLSGAPASNMFDTTFYNCSGLTGFGDKTYVPGTFLENINTDTSVSNQVRSMFYNTQLANPCPAGTYAVTREQFNDAGKPWCSPCPAGTNSPAGSTNVSQCVDVFAITLSNYNASSTHGTIYEKYNTGWYNDFAATTSINTAPIPTRSGYTFRGFYATTQSDLTATGGDGTRVIDASGTLPANTTYTADTNLYASWAQNCNPGAGCTCNLIVNNDGTVTYQTGANSGYNVTSGSGTYAPVCSGNSIALTWDGDANGTPISCTYGGTFVPPTPEPRPGYVFTGWKVKPSCASLIRALDADTGGTAYGYARLNESNGSQESTYGLTQSSGQWAVQFSYGTVYGQAKCNATQGANKGDVNDNLSTNVGQYCWCQATGFTPTSDSYTSGPQCTINPVSSSWVVNRDNGTFNNCKNGCASFCALDIQNSSFFRSVVFNVAGQ